MLVNGHNLHVEQHGPVSGMPVFFLHHGLGSVRAWREQVPDVSAAGFRAIPYDRWGYGKSESRSGFSMPCFEEDVEDLLALMDSLHLESASLVGHSDGGTIALYFAAAHPERVRRLVSVAAHIYIERPVMLSVFDDIRSSYEGDADFKRKFNRQHEQKAEDVFEHWYSGWRRPENLSWDIRPVIRQITSPTLVVQGTKDEHASQQHAGDIAAEIPGAQLWLLPGAGHMLPQDHADAFNFRLVEFLS
jgi:pimeloyl-ACP methyl ester carboxylesterase